MDRWGWLPGSLPPGAYSRKQLPTGSRRGKAARGGLLAWRRRQLPGGGLLGRLGLSGRCFTGGGKRRRGKLCGRLAGGGTAWRMRVLGCGVVRNLD